MKRSDNSIKIMNYIFGRNDECNSCWDIDSPAHKYWANAIKQKHLSLKQLKRLVDRIYNANKTL